jgi:hypothetical protein
VAALACQVQAGIVVGNLNQEDAGAFSLQGSRIGGGSFTVGSGSPYYTLDKIQLQMAIDAGRTFAIRIYDGTADMPGTVLGLLSQVEPSGQLFGAPFAYSFVPSSTLYLAQGATYWAIAQRISGTQSDNVRRAASVSYDVQQPGWSFGANGRYSDNLGASWSAWSGLPRMSVEATATPVPEPSALALIAGFGLLGLAGVRKLRR